jgi:hypothetical protein
MASSSYTSTRPFFRSDPRVVGENAYHRTNLRYADLARDFCQTVFGDFEPAEHAADPVQELHDQLHRFRLNIMRLDTPSQALPPWRRRLAQQEAAEWGRLHGMHYNDLRDRLACLTDGQYHFSKPAHPTSAPPPLYVGLHTPDDYPPPVIPPDYYRPSMSASLRPSEKPLGSKRSFSASEMY